MLAIRRVLPVDLAPLAAGATALHRTRAVGNDLNLDPGNCGKAGAG
jgi:hypothetical protein